MKAIILNACLLISAVMLAACSGGKTEYLNYSPNPVGPVGLDMKAAVYKLTFPTTNNILTITTDQSNNTVYGAYTIKKPDGTLVSSGKVDNLVTQLSLVGHKYFGSPCPDEAISITIDPKNVNEARTEADISVSGQKSCSETLPVSTQLHIKRATTALITARGALNASQELAITLYSGDNINFVGDLALINNSLPASFSGTIVGTITNSNAAPDTAQVLPINNPAAYGLTFDHLSNVSGHFFTLNDNITKISGSIRTAFLGQSSAISEVSLTAFTDFINSQMLGPVNVFSVLQNYTPL